MVVSRWSEEELRNLEKGDFKFDTIGLRGRDGTKEDIDSFVPGLLVDMQNHGEYQVLVASGHVRSGKTRIGQEVFKRVSEIVRCSYGFHSSFYLPVNLGNGLGFAESFDGHVSPGEALGARIINGYIGNHTTLKAVAADKAIDVISGEGEEERRQPVVVHIDEHGQYARRWANYTKLKSKQQSRERDDDDDLDFIEQGRQKVVDMVETLVGIATNSDQRYRRTIIIVLSGTSYGDISPRHDSLYQLMRLKLPMLNPQMCLELASERIDSKLEKLSSLNIQLPDKVDIVDSTLFKVALADTGGLPGWVVELGSLACNSNVWKTGSYVSAIHDAVKRYLKAPNHDRVKISMLVGFARPPLAMSTELLQEYVEASGSKRRRRTWTVQDASDSGSVNVVETTEQSIEIRIPAAVMMAYASSDENVSVPIDIRMLCCAISKNDGWTWQRFETAHIFYLAAVLCAIAKTRKQFWTDKGHEVTVSNVLASVSPPNHDILRKAFTPQDSFDALEIIKDEQQCIPRGNARSQVHAVNTADLNHMHQAQDGTPIIDAYVNLKLSCSEGISAADTATANETTTLFIQYKHSKLESDANVPISFMNGAVEKLENYLSGTESNWGHRPWIFLWVTNRKIVDDAVPHPRLLWVGKDKLIDHAPLIGRRGLIPLEGERIEEEEKAT